jgi:DeoR/GlpR family transcriptional regulator of sugar metabolism
LSKIFREERLQSIAERVRAGQIVRVNELAQEFGVSPSSIRIDLNELEGQGILKRTHGGAILAEALYGRLIVAKSPFETRQQQLQPEKEAIGRAAAALIDDGDTLILDAGSTTLYVARHLGAKRGLTILTNAVAPLADLMAIPDAQVYVTGGRLHPVYATLLGDVALDTIRRFHTTKAILGIDGLSLDRGLSVTDPAVAAAKRQMMEASDQLIVVADHTKLDQVSLYSLAPLETMHTFVTDAGAAPETVEAIRACGPRVVIAEL